MRHCTVFKTGNRAVTVPYTIGDTVWVTESCIAEGAVSHRVKKMVIENIYCRASKHGPLIIEFASNEVGFYHSYHVYKTKREALNHEHKSH